jgi:hypothetical protein
VEDLRRKELDRDKEPCFDSEIPSTERMFTEELLFISKVGYDAEENYFLPFQTQSSLNIVTDVLSRRLGFKNKTYIAQPPTWSCG